MQRLTLAQLRAAPAGTLRSLHLVREPGAAPLTTLPDALLDHAPMLEALDLSGHALDSLPPAFARFGQLRRLFLSFNRFEAVPIVLGELPALSQLGLRGNQIAHFDDAAVPPQLRWLTLTDNRLRRLPNALGERPSLEKVGLAGNQLDALPQSLAGAPRLALLRLSANALPALPGWLTELPALAWLGWGGNPLEAGGQTAPRQPLDIPWQQLTLGALLGQGASGHIHRADWQAPGQPTQAVAVKLFKGEITSDGYPASEVAACLAAAGHPQVMAALGRTVQHPAGAQGLVMPLLPGGWRVLAEPPSADSCSRDVYPPGLGWPLAVALQMGRDIATAAAHLRARGLQHADLYAHNTLWDGHSGRAVLSDFGAASFIPAGADAHGLESLEVRALGLLLEELWARCQTPVPQSLAALQQACVQPALRARPRLADVAAALEHALGQASNDGPIGLPIGLPSGVLSGALGDPATDTPAGRPANGPAL